MPDHRKEYADHDFGCSNVEILHSENNKRKREFMEMLYIKREGAYSINLKTDLVKYDGCYDSMLGSFRYLIERHTQGVVLVSCWRSWRRVLGPHGRR